ncbi:hypothetical protein [Actinomadura flavalba]|uniref:hypothetical protein n=1 Tax=Actinomadura flavalba TaxID=1120938 RepID=UPI00037B5D4C|nr:hypothetical protein [Actinomadura flavalba]
MGFNVFARKVRDAEQPCARRLRALALIEDSRGLWHADIAAYDVRRRAAKRAGRRVPDEPFPHVPRRWYGDARAAAVHALAYGRARLDAPPPLGLLVDACLAADGDPGAEVRAEAAAYKGPPALRRMARLIVMAADGDAPGVVTSRAFRT